MRATWTLRFSLFVATALAAGSVHAGDWFPWGAKCMEKFCCPEAEIVKTEKSCWNVEMKEICIPAIRFPWTKDCEVRCGKVRRVKVLKKRTHTVEQCGYKWNITGQGTGLCRPCEATAPIPPAPAASDE